MEDEEEGVEAMPSTYLVRKCWRDKRGSYHRLNGPAIIYNDGDTTWFRHGLRHRDDGPALVWTVENREEWYRDGERYEPSAHELMVWKMKKKSQ